MEVPGKLVLLQCVSVNFDPPAGLVLWELQQGTATIARHRLGKKVSIIPVTSMICAVKFDMENLVYIYTFDNIQISYKLPVPRVFDQYEIDIEMTKHRHSYINSGITRRSWNDNLEENLQPL